MKIWLIWVMELVDEYAWLEAAWTDDQTAESHGKWEAEVKRIRKYAADNNYEMRIQAVNVPGVHEMFATPIVEAEAT